MLVVEDDGDSLYVLGETFRRMGAEVVCVPDGAEALAAVAFSLKGEPFDLAVVDVAMRHIDGMALYKALRCFESCGLYPHPLRVKFYTAYEESSNMVEKGKVPPEDYYVKGTDTLRLIRDVEVMSCGVRPRTSSEGIG